MVIFEMEPRIGKKKSTNFSCDEQELLVALVKTYKDVIDNKKSGQTTWEMKNNAWKKLEQEFNSQSKSTFRDAQALKTKFRNMKKECKQKFAVNKKGIIKTGGGPPDKVDITSIDFEMKDLMGTTIVEGLPAIHDDDHENENEELLQNNISQWNDIEIEYIDESALNAARLVDKEVIHNKLVQSKDSPSTSCDREIVESSQKCEPQTQQKGSNKNWAHYSPAMLQGPLDKKLKTNVYRKESGGNQRLRKKVACTKSQLYEEVMQAKLDFMKLQEAKFLEEHKYKIRLLKMEIKLKAQQLKNAQIPLSEDSTDDNEDE